MPAGSLLTLLDDITSVLDDVATMTKIAAKKTSGILGDDLALNAQQVTGVAADREIPVVWAVAKGSLVNKAILVPAALGLSAVAPWAVKPLLMVGGAFLCFEGFEKVAHKLLHAPSEDAAHRAEHTRALAAGPEEILALEKEKIRGAIRTDFILSAEIVAITLAAVEQSSFAVQVGVLVGVSLLMTVGVYGLVAGIVKLDDAGLHLARGEGARRQAGRAILAAAPVLMRTLSVVGTAAMFLVGGGILVHGVPPLLHWTEGLSESPGGALGAVLPTLVNGAAGVVAGGAIVAIVATAKRAFDRRPSPKA
jgi:predicted DNA repair protein MutK